MERVGAAGGEDVVFMGFMERLGLCGGSYRRGVPSGQCHFLGCEFLSCMYSKSITESRSKVPFVC